MTLAKAVSMKYNKTIEKCSNEEIYYALLDMTKQMAEDKVSNEGKKKLYYISAEFLITTDCSNRYLITICRKRLQTHGSHRTAV